MAGRPERVDELEEMLAEKHADIEKAVSTQESPPPPETQDDVQGETVMVENMEFVPRLDVPSD